MPKKTQAKKSRTRLHAQIGLDAGTDVLTVGVDRENHRLAGFSAIMVGPALGHDMDVDQVTLEQTAQHGNAAPSGIKARFTHPGLSNDGLGTFLGVCKNFRVEGDRVRCDLHFDPTARKTPRHGDLEEYVQNLAANAPDKFGASIVFDVQREVRLNADGTRMRDAEGNPLPPLARVKKLWAVDIVDDPAANADGLFSAEPPDTLVRQASELLTRYLGDRPEAEVRGRIDKFLARHFRTPHKEPEMSTAPATPATTPASAPAPVAEAKAELATAPAGHLTEAQHQAALSAAVTAERNRCAKLVGLGRVARQDAELSEKAIADGVTVETFQGQLLTIKCAQAPALQGNAAPTTELPADPDAEFRKEYAAGRATYEANGTTEAQYINSRRIDCGRAVLVPGSSKK